MTSMTAPPVAANATTKPPAGEMRNETRGGTGRLFTGPVVIGLGVWVSVAVLLAQAGAFQIEFGGIPVAIVAGIALPVIGFVTAWQFSAPVRAFVEAQDLALLTALQGWRVVGAAFLFLWAYGLLPAVFALPAGIGELPSGWLRHLPPSRWR